MKYLVALFITVVTISAVTTGKVCSMNRDCQPRPPAGLRYYCDSTLNLCYTRQLTTPQKIDGSCTTSRDCGPARHGVRFYCHSTVGTCYKRQALEPNITDRFCETWDECYNAPAGVEYYCDKETKTCNTRTVNRTK